MSKEGRVRARRKSAATHSTFMNSKTPGSANSFERGRTKLDKAEQRERMKKLRKENEKLDKETKVLDLQLSRRHQRNSSLQAFVGLAGVITAFVAILGLFFSSYQWFQNTEISRQTHIEEQLNSTLRQLGEQSEPQRLYAAVLLQTFLTGTSDRRDSQVLLAYTNGLSVEKSRAVRNAMVSSLRTLDEKAIKRELLDRALGDLIRSSRALMQEGQLSLKHRDDYSTLAQEDTIEAKADSIAGAISILLRKGAQAKDMSRAYLAHVDLSGLDLHDVSFDDTVLVSTSFKNATLYNTRYSGADLARTSFVSADLRKAQFIQPRHFNYVSLRVLEREPSQGSEIVGADFSCADLREANFEGLPILPIYSREPRPNDQSNVFFMIEGFRFVGSNLEKTDFTKLLVFGSYEGELSCPFGWYEFTSQWVPHLDQNFFQGTISPTLIKESSKLCQQDLLAFAGRFSGSNWDLALWPPPLKEWLSKNPPEKWEPDKWELGCTPRAPSKK